MSKDESFTVVNICSTIAEIIEISNGLVEDTIFV